MKRPYSKDYILYVSIYMTLQDGELQKSNMRKFWGSNRPVLCLDCVVVMTLNSKQSKFIEQYPQSVNFTTYKFFFKLASPALYHLSLLFSLVSNFLPCSMQPPHLFNLPNAYLPFQLPLGPPGILPLVWQGGVLNRPGTSQSYTPSLVCFWHSPSYYLNEHGQITQLSEVSSI